MSTMKVELIQKYNEWNGCPLTLCHVPEHEINVNDNNNTTTNCSNTNDNNIIEKMNHK